MKKIYFAILLMLLIITGCADDFVKTSSGTTLDGETVEAFLSLAVSELSVSTDDTRADGPEVITPEEEQIDNIWVFQYDATSGNQLINAAYYIINDQNELNSLPVILKEGVASKICVVANTNNPEWGRADAFKTYTGLKEGALPDARYITLDKDSFRSIPMEGEESATVESNSEITMHVFRMYAKLKISFGELIEGMKPESVEVSKIPYYCRVHTLANGENAASYGEISFVNKTFNASEAADESGQEEEVEYVIYVPENLQGETLNSPDFKEEKNMDAPDDALAIKLTMHYFNDSDPNIYEVRPFTVYPGGNTYNNFNIKRNNVYRIKVNIKSADLDVHTPSSNCFVVIPGNGLSFEPYNRTEIGGGYNIKDYLDSNEPAKKIDRVEIVWQTKDAIGDNSEGDLVWYKLNEQNPEHSKIFVKTNKEGNAVVAAYSTGTVAGEADEDDKILWSWHIWITDNNPGNTGTAITYSTYRWDEKGIKHGEGRVLRYDVMPCNLGALANSPEDMGNENTADSWYCKAFRTYGTLYQWGRKDPFPPMKHRKASEYFNYSSIDLKSGPNLNDGANIEIYDNSHNQIIMTTTGADYKEDELFKTILSTDIGTTKEEGLNYSINNPTVFIAGAVSFKKNGNYNNFSLYRNRGDWLPERDECLWGGVTRIGKKYYRSYGQTGGGVLTEADDNPRGQNDRAIWDNFGPNKTIFDPCPAGWRMPPGDLWLGFTVNGLNSAWGSNINSPTTLTLNYIQKNNGYWICLDGWKVNDADKLTFFPTQGSRLASGEPYLSGVCGNYHNATTDAPIQSNGVVIDRVNILHTHSDGGAKINTFEDQLLYYNKAVGGPVRCVRDTNSK